MSARSFEIFATLRQCGVELWTEGGRIFYRAPEGVLTPALRAELAARKAEILSLLAPPNPLNHRGGDLPLSFAQQRLWFLNRLLPESPAYNIPAPFRLTGRCDPAALERTLSEIVRRHEVLRTTVHAPAGRPVQRIEPPAPVPLPRIDLGGLPAAVRPAEARRLAREVTERPFDLARGPLLRAHLLHRGGEEHELLLVQHHIVTDGWSAGVLAREIAALYPAACPTALPALPLQYADFAAWQRERLDGEAVAPLLAWWRERLDGSTPLELLPDRPRPAVQGHRGAIREMALDASTAAALRSLGQERGATLFMTLLAAFQALAGRWAGQDDVTVGSPVAGRDRPGLEGLIGFFINNLVLRVDVGGRISFTELLGRTREAALGAYAHQELPFERLVEELAPERDLARNPLFQVAFALQPPWHMAADLPGARLELLPFDLATTRLDLELHLWAEPAGLRGRAIHATDLFDAATVARFLSSYERLLLAVAARPDAPWEDLPLLSAAEQHQLSTEWNDTEVLFPAGLFVHEMVTAHARRDPDAPAVVDGARRLTYSELDSRAGFLAARLCAAGVGPEVVVALCAERSIEMVLGTVAVVKAGGAYLPLDPSHPPERLARLISDSGAPVVLAQAHIAAALPVDELRGRRLLLLDGADGAPPALPAAVTAGAPAYLIQTSGSTGRPKSVQVTHGGLANMVRWHHAWSGLAPGHHTTQVAAPAFDATVFEIWPCLTAGACLHIADDPARLSPPRLIEWLAREGATTAFLPTPLAEALLDEPWPAGMALRALHTAGDRLHLRPRPGLPFALYNLYGPAEVTVLASGCRVPPRGTAAAATPPPIGRPIANARIHLLDGHLQLVPLGAPGEIAVGGPGLARGYLGRPKLTAERFVPDPFAALRGEPGARLYRTGDLARRLGDGTLDFLGRADRQVKIRGVRIEPGEIEAALCEHPIVQACAVVAREDAPGAKVLVAYLSVRQGAVLEARDLRRFLSAKLPASLVPAAFVTLPALPLSANGKIDREALPAPPRESSAAAPRTPDEATLCRIWAQVLGRDDVGVHDNFFALGGESILSMLIVAQARQVGLRITPRQFFQHPVLADLAAVAVAEAPELELPVADGNPGGEVPLTPVQRWFFDRGLPDPHHFNQAFLLTVPEPADGRKLEAALARLITRHDALRLRFAGGTQTVAPVDGLAPFTRADLTALPEPVRRGALEAACEAAQASLDLDRGPLLRALLFTPGTDGAARLLLVVHHLGVDGVSWRILLEELEALYRLPDAALPSTTTPFATWASRLAARGDPPEPEGREASAPLPPPLAVGVEGEARTVRIELGPETTRALLREVPEAYGTRIDDALLTALSVAFAERLGAASLWIDLEGHGREEELAPGADLTRTVGWFTSLSPVRLEAATGDRGNPGAALQATKERLRQVRRREGGFASPRAEVCFNYLGQFDQALSGPALFHLAPEDSGPLHSPRGARSHRLEVTGQVLGGRLAVDWTYTPQNARAAVEGLAASFLAFLESLVEHCRAPEAYGYTPSDFPDAGLTQERLDRALRELERAAGAG
jgi:amino acid adenylation domain-containing protein/non-ribosomal peptide synthase protein (TIGR01720 family)